MIKKKSVHKKDVDEEIIRKGRAVIKDFDNSQEIYVFPKKVENKLISIRLPLAMIKSLRNIAIIKGDIGYQQIIKSYIADGLSREMDRNWVSAQPQAALLETSSDVETAPFGRQETVTGVYEKVA